MNARCENERKTHPTSHASHVGVIVGVRRHHPIHRRETASPCRLQRFAFLLACRSLVRRGVLRSIQRTSNCEHSVSGRKDKCWCFKRDVNLVSVSDSTRLRAPTCMHDSQHGWPVEAADRYSYLPSAIVAPLLGAWLSISFTAKASGGVSSKHGAGAKKNGKDACPAPHTSATKQKNHCRQARRRLLLWASATALYVTLTIVSLARAWAWTGAAGRGVGGDTTFSAPNFGDNQFADTDTKRGLAEKTDGLAHRLGSQSQRAARRRLRLWAQCVSRRPSSTLCYSSLGVALEDSGFNVGAVRAYESGASLLVPNDSQAINLL